MKKLNRLDAVQECDATGPNHGTEVGNTINKTNSYKELY